MQLMFLQFSSMAAMMQCGFMVGAVRKHFNGQKDAFECLTLLC